MTNTPDKPAPLKKSSSSEDSSDVTTKLTLRLPQKAGRAKPHKTRAATNAPNRQPDKRPDKQPERQPNRPTSKPPTKEAHKPDLIPADARRLCLQLLRRLFDDKMHFDQAFNNLPGLHKLEPRDRGFVRHLASMVLRHHGQLQYTIEALIPNPPTGPARLILMMGIAQLCVLETGAHAATNTSVELMRQSGDPRLAGLTNAVMRSLIREDFKSWHETDPLDNLPDHLYESWEQAYGRARCQAIMRQVQQVPPLDISAKSPADWVAPLNGTLLDQTIRTVFEGDISQMPGYDEGAWWVQDIAAALPARLLPKDATTIIDLCAAPGGKTAQLASRGAHVIAIEKDIKRADRLEANLNRLNLSVDLQVVDGLDYKPAALVDAVLLDAPCSATGTVRRRPDILLRVETEQSAKRRQNVADLQLALARRAADWLKPGGILIYTTCSLQPEEGEDIIRTLLETRPDLSVLPILAAEAGGLASAITTDGWMRILPDCLLEAGGNDGFFIARLQRYGA